METPRQACSNERVETPPCSFWGTPRGDARRAPAFQPWGTAMPEGAGKALTEERGTQGAGCRPVREAPDSLPREPAESIPTPGLATPRSGVFWGPGGEAGRGTERAVLLLDIGAASRVLGAQQPEAERKCLGPGGEVTSGRPASPNAEAPTGTQGNCRERSRRSPGQDPRGKESAVTLPEPREPEALTCLITPLPPNAPPSSASSDALGSGAWPERGKDRTGGGLAEAGDIISLTQAENDLWPELCTKSKGGGGD